MRLASAGAPVCVALVALFVASAPMACNALTGASDLATCDECGQGRPGGGNEGGAGADGSMLADAGPDALPPTCSGAQTACEGNVSAQCVNDAWVKTTCPKLCDATSGTCADYPSCQNAAGASCVVDGATSCCDTAMVPGGTFNRRNEGGAPATISPFQLDKYEVTVGRMRAFVAAGGGTRLAPPAAGAGGSPKIAGSGWNPVWDVFLPADVTALRASFNRTNPTWTDQPGANERLPINDVTWFIAFAFCAWDGGRLPTYAEMSFAATGGSEQRVYPWSTPPTGTTINRERAAYNCNYTLPEQSTPPSYCSDAAIVSSPCDTTVCFAPATCQYPAPTGCAFNDIAPVGSLPLGAGKWGHFDLSGNVAELVADVDAPLPLPCIDCLRAPPTLVMGTPGHEKLNANFLLTGGGWDDSSTSSMLNSSYNIIRDADASDDVGFRCAR